MGLQVTDKLLREVLPTCRKAGIRVLWLGWGLTDSDIEELPPADVKGYDEDINFDDPAKRRLGPGQDLGRVKLEDGTEIGAGRVMMRDQWNTEFYTPLMEKEKSGDMHVYKDRLSGFWGGTEVEEALREKGIRTLLFSGANTDQCVAASLVDAFNKGWDCLLLSDACATWSPEFAKRSVEYNCEIGWGFVLRCKDLAEGVESMRESGQ